MLASTTDELAVLFRQDVDDPLEGVDAAHPDSENLWSNANIYRYMTEACDATARKTKVLNKVATWAFAAGDEVVPLPRHVLHVQSVRLASNNRELSPRNINEMPDIGLVRDYGLQPSGFSPVFNASGNPRVFIRDYDNRALRLVPTPAAADSIIVQCWITIAVPMTAGMMLPFMEVPDQALLLTYMKYLAYRKQDADTLDLQRSDAFKAEWELESSKREVEVSNIRRRPGVIRAHC